MDSTAYAIAYQYWTKPNGYKNTSTSEVKKIASEAVQTKVVETKV
tara:strand:- start:32 stop:166 length:135 start_codon:yes stop_codon:yes gene_type:complete